MARDEAQQQAEPGAFRRAVVLVGLFLLALIVGGGPGISASCARLFRAEGMRVAVAARNIEKNSLANLVDEHDVRLFACDAADPQSVESLFADVTQQFGRPRLVVHNIDGRVQDVFGKRITDVSPEHVLATLKNSTFSAFLVGQKAAQAMLARYIAVQNATATGSIPAPDVDVEQLRATLESNPEIILAVAQVRQAEASIDLARSEKRPDFGINVSYGRRDPMFGDVVSVMGSITLPIFAGRRQNPRIAAAETEASAAQAIQLDRLRELQAQFEADLAAWRSAYRQWQRATEELLPLAQSRADLERASFAANRAELLDVIEAIKALALLQIEILEREEATVEAATTLRLTYTEFQP